MIKFRVPALLILILVSSIYSGTLSYPWHFDDLPNITQNSKIQISDLKPTTLWQTFYGNPGGEGISRPVAFFTFSLNWYFGKTSTFGYHLFNIFIHICTAIILYRTIVLLLSTPKLFNKFEGSDKHSIALLAAVLWAAHPIQIQAVTYIVQRMASLAAFFYIWAIFWYLRCTLSQNTKQQFISACASAFCFILAIGSKENAAILPFSLLLIDLTFQNKPCDIFRKILRYLLISINIILLLGISYYFINLILSNDFFAPIGFRPYSLYERLITQPRIIIFYLSLLFYPIATRFSIDHSIITSTSLLQPITTTPAIFFLITLFVVGIYLLKKRSITGLAIIFFLINHLIESTIIPLEMIFEHRNYLPSFFIFLPIAVIINKGLKFYRSVNTTIYVFLSLFISVIVFMFGWGTYLRNNIWSSQEILWRDALEKAPDNARPLSYLGQVYGWEKPQTKENLTLSIDYYTRALTKEGPNLPYKNAMICNIAGIYFNYQLYADAAQYYEIALKNDPNLHKFRYGYAQTLIMQGKFTESLQQIDYLIEHKNEITEISKPYNLRGLVLLWMNRPNEAISDLKSAIHLSNYKSHYYYEIGVGLSRAGYFKQADWFLKQALKPKVEIEIYLSLIENSIRRRDFAKAENFSQDIYSMFNMDIIQQSLSKKGNSRYASVPVDIELIKPFIIEAGKQSIQDINNL